MNHKDKYLSFIILLAIPVFVFIYYFTANFNVYGPTIQGDEGGYLSMAAAFSGYWVDNATSYMPGYSLLISPSFYWGEDPGSVFAIVKALNALMWSLSALLLVLFLREFNLDVKPSLNIYAVAFISMLYPAWAVFSGYSMSENAFVLVYMLTVYFSLKLSKYGGVYWIFFSLALVFLYFIHEKSIVVHISALIFALSILFIKKIKKLIIFYYR